MVAITAPQRPSLLHDRRARSRRPASASVAARRCQVVGAFAAMLAACAVWAQAGVGVRPGSGPLAASGAGPTRPIAARVWVVQPGETVWGIARQLQPTGDVRPLVDELGRQAHGKPLQIGERLLLP